MYSFFVTAHLSSQQRLALCGGADVLGGWDVLKAVQLRPVVSREDTGFQNWTASINMSSMGYRYFEYRYIKFLEDGRVYWEAMKFNRNLLVVPEVNYTLHDGEFGAPPPPARRGPRGPALPAPRAWRVAICGSSVAFGWRAHADQGWAARLAEALQRYGHQTVNVAVHGYTTQKTRADFQRSLHAYGARWRGAFKTVSEGCWQKWKPSRLRRCWEMSTHMMPTPRACSRNCCRTPIGCC